MKKLAVWVALAVICVFAADEKEAAQLPDGEGKALVGKVCIDCHGAGNFRRARMTPEEWSDSVADMVDRGAKASPADVDAIVGYLAKNFGRESKVQMNSAPLVEIKVVLGFSVPESQAVVDYREVKGGIKSFEELLKVPGVDAAKAEAARAKMAF
uniref:Cytochrome c domain-containing protein n=1 Tax=Solibacter usitatus (strain Ellin6076) TaxID=234267 RepID=Q025F6_SOLUE